MRTFAPITRIVAAVVILTAGVAAQQKPQASTTPSPKPRPSFSGRWTIISPKSNEGGVNIVTQDDKTLTTEQPSGSGSHKMTYQLDGVERRLAIPGRGADITLLAKASWDGDHIVISTNIAYPNGMKTQSKETWSIDDQGRLVIDFSETGPNGQPGPSEKVIHVKK